MTAPATTRNSIGPASQARAPANCKAQNSATPAEAPVEITSKTTQAKRNAGKRPMPSRKNSNQPPSRGIIAANSAKVMAPAKAARVPIPQAAK
jgi:hypothetical protein